MRNCSIRKIAQILGQECEDDFDVTGYQIDSRMIAPGELFFALPGERVQGEAFIPDAKRRGALAAVVSKGYPRKEEGVVLLFVDDVLEALQKLAKELVKECSAPIIGITGSLGKTTCKEFLATLLQGQFRIYSSEKSYNSQRMFPITLLNRKGDEEVLIFEMGMSQPGEMQRLVEICPPDIGVLTKVSYSHPAYFKGLEEIALHKGKIFSNPKTKIAILDHDLLQYGEMIEKIQGEKLTFSIDNPEADFYLSNDFYLDEKGVRKYHFDPLLLQKHFLHNFLAAVAVCRSLKVSFDQINKQIPFLKLPSMRFEKVENEGITFINDAYNASPESMQAALSSLPEPKEGGKRIAVLGMMAEMGDLHEKMHRLVGKEALKFVDHLIVYRSRASGIYEEFVAQGKPAEIFEDLEEVKKRVASLACPGDVVLIKGSRSEKMEEILL